MILLLGLHLPLGTAAEAQTDPFQEGLPPGLIARLEDARTLRKSGDLDQAIDGLSKLVASEPDFYRAQYNLGLAYAEKKDYDLAIDNFLLALELQKVHGIEDATLYNAIGWTYLLQGNYNEAEEYLQQAFERREKLSDASTIRVLNNLGTLYIYKDQPRKAEEYLTVAARKYGSKTAEKNLLLIEDLERRTRATKLRLQAHFSIQSTVPFEPGDGEPGLMRSSPLFKPFLTDAYDLTFFPLNPHFTRGISRRNYNASHPDGRRSETMDLVLDTRDHLSTDSLEARYAELLDDARMRLPGGGFLEIDENGKLHFRNVGFEGFLLIHPDRSLTVWDQNLRPVLIVLSSPSRGEPLILQQDSEQGRTVFELFFGA